MLSSFGNFPRPKLLQVQAVQLHFLPKTQPPVQEQFRHLPFEFSNPKFSCIKDLKLKIPLGRGFLCLSYEFLNYNYKVPLV